LGCWDIKFYFWIPGFSDGSRTTSVARNKARVLKVFAKSQVLRRTPGPQRKELMEFSNTMQMQVLLYVMPGRLADETGGTRYKLPEPEGARAGMLRMFLYFSVVSFVGCTN
jgi:hypothetical protein